MRTFDNTATKSSVQCLRELVRNYEYFNRHSSIFMYVFRYKNEYGLAKHMTEQHRHTDPVNCPVCNRVCLSKHRLNQHMRAAHAERKHECVLCDKAFRCPKNLKVRFPSCCLPIMLMKNDLLINRNTSQHTPVRICTNVSTAIRNLSRAPTCIPI